MNRKHLLLAGYAMSFALSAYLVSLATPVFTGYTIGKVLGVWSLTALTFQLLLVTRMDMLESAIGYDRITRWHAANGMLILGLVLLHPTLIFSSQLLNLNFSAVTAFVLNTPAAMLGELVTLLLVFQIVSTLYWKGLDYEHWRIIHRVGYVIVALGFLHSFLLGSDITVPPENLLSIWWLMLAGVCIGSVAYRYGYRLLRKQRKFRVADVRQETHDVHTVELQPEDEDVEHEPGQFAFVTFHSMDVPDEEHHFTIASAPDRDGFEYTVKAVGDFTTKLGNLEEDDTAVIEGPYGAFTLDDSDTSVVMVAGGIGITPFMSMLRHMDRTTGRETHLFYGNRTVDDIVFRDELAELAERNDWLTVTHVLSEEDVEGFEHGYINEDLLQDADPDAQYYVCGPPVMMDAVEDALRSLDVSRSQITTERFSLRDISWKRLLPL